MNKKLVSLVLSGLIVLNNTGSLEAVYADNTQTKELITNEDTKSTQVIYLENGEGSRIAGNGTKNSPYQNIRTALDKIQDGGTLKLVGEVVYHYYEAGSQGDALPLFINKNITIDGEGGGSLYVRAPIQLGANVTFKNLRLEMMPQYTLGRILGQFIERSTTIYVAGNKLTLDNVNTKFGSNPEQYNQRPYISGGAYKNYDIKGNKSIINIINPNEETKFSGIYAGDYYADRTLDVEINLDGKVIDNKIYTGGHDHNLNGNVTVNLGNKGNITKFDKKRHNGQLNVNLNKDTYIVDFDAKNIDNLTLQENSGIILSKDATFDVNNVTLKNDARIDFRDMTNGPTVKGNFNGEEVVSDTKKGGTIFLNNNQTLNITGQLSGTTRLNNRDTQYVERFVENHTYVTADSNSTGNLTIKDSMYDNYELNVVNESNLKKWSVNRLQLQNSFDDFSWVSEDNRVKPNRFTGSNAAEGKFEIAFIDDTGTEYYPDDSGYTDFEYTLTKLDANADTEEEILIKEVEEDGSFIYTGIDKDGNVSLSLGGDIYGLPVPMVHVNDISRLNNNKMILKVTHIRTGKSISKNIYVVTDNKQLAGNVRISGSPIEGNTISADISGLPQDVQDIRYEWYVKDNASSDYELIPNQTTKDFVLTNEYVGKTIKVKVEAMNYNGQVESSDVTIKSKAIAPTIDGLDPITINAGKVDSFNKGENLHNVTAKDQNQTPIADIDVLDKVEKPQPGTNQTFKIRYSVTDVDGNTTEKIREVTVTNQKPTISGLTDIVITEGDSYDITDGVTATDTEDGNIASDKISYPTDDISSLSVGLRKIRYSVTDNDGNTTEEERRVIVQRKSSTTGPEITGVDDITIKVNQVDEFNNNKLKGVTVSDDIDTGLVATVTGTVEKPSPGTNKDSELVYTAVDGDLNTTTIKRKVTVTNQIPTISGLDTISITEGDNIDLKSGVTANDHEDGNITKNLVCLTDATTLKVGENTIYYTVTDADGNKVDGTRKVIVSKKVEQQPETPDTEIELPTTKPEDSIVQLPQINGVEFEQGDATIDSPLSVKVDTLEGLNQLLDLTKKSDFTIDNVEQVKGKEDDNFIIYLVKITKATIKRAEESYFMEVKVAKDNKEIIQKLESVVDTSNRNDTTIEGETNNNTSNNNSNNNVTNNNSSDNNNTTNNSENNSNEVNKEESPKTYDGGIGSYLLSGIGALGLLSALKKKKRRK